LCLVRSRAADSCAPLSGLEAVAEWAVDAGRDGPLVMGGQGSRFFSTGTYGSMTSYNDVTTLPSPVKFFLELQDVKSEDFAQRNHFG
jgi:hypothetical protein